MSWVGITSLIALGCVAVGLSYFLLARHYKKSRGWRSSKIGPAVKRSEAEDSALQADATTPCMTASCEPPASGQQTSETPDNVDTIAPEVKPVRPTEASTDVGQRDFTEGPPSEKCGIESKPIPQLDKRYKETKTQGELLAEQQTDSDLNSDVGGTISHTEEVELPAKEQEPYIDQIEDGEHIGAQLETGKFAVGDDNATTSRADGTENKTPGGEETSHGTFEEDVQTQSSETHMDWDADRLISEPDASRQTNEIFHRAEPQKGKPEDLSEGGRGAKAKEEQRETASKKTRERLSSRPTGAAAPPDMLPARDRSTAGGEGKSAGVTEQISAGSVVDDIESDKIRRLRRPSRYRPPSQEPLAAPQPSGKHRPARRTPQKTLALTVRLLFDRSGHLRIGLLPQREADLPEEIVIGQGENRFMVTSVHDAWYEDVFPENLSELIGAGITWEGCTESEVLGYWRLSGRDLYVLATHSDINGFAQVTRLKIGREHVILCRNSLLPEVEPILQKAGCSGFTKIDDSYGVPAGWTVIRGVVPTNVARVENGPGILSILQPEPELEIDLQGGIYLHQSTWLSGFPPNICVLGDMMTEIEVFIDGNKAFAGDDGSFRNQGYDIAGEHRVSIPLANMSRTYRISENDENWSPWDAYSMERFQLCGPLILAMDASETPRVAVVPSSNSVIVGAKPGDIAWCPYIRGPKQVGCVTFHPVWALPRDAFGSDKRTTRIMLLDALRLDQAKRRQFTGKEASHVLAWSTAILNASRKGLSLDSSDEYAVILWREYKAYARSLWKMLK